MGRPMARNLVRAGFSLVVRDADVGLQDRFAREHGCRAASTPEAFSGAEIVITMLPDDGIVQEAIVGWGIGGALPRGAVVVDMSSSNPIGTRALAELLAPREVSVVDAPVSGG